MAMAIAQPGGGGGRRRGGRGKRRPMADINVTPMVDVMLVLLIVFMVAAPLLSTGVQIDLPKTAAKELNTDSKPIAVSVDATGAFFIDKTPVDETSLVEQLATLTGGDLDTRVFVRADTASNYGAVAKLLGILSKAGYTKVGLNMAPQDGQ